MSHMEALCDYHVTSRVVKASMNGFYPYYVQELMIPHEAIRREMALGLAALRSLDVKTQAWKVEHFSTWFLYLLAPIVQQHNNIEQNIVLHFYKKLGAELPSNIQSSHPGLIAGLDNIARKLEKLVAKVKVDPTSDDSVTSANQLVQDYEAWVVQMENHFEEEETTLPPIFKTFGEEKSEECSQLVFQTGLRIGGKVFQNFLCSILHAMGYVFPGCAKRPEEQGWAGRVLREKIFQSVPIITRNMNMQAWNKRYQDLEEFVVAAAGDVEISKKHDSSSYYETGCVVV